MMFMLTTDEKTMYVNAILESDEHAFNLLDLDYGFEESFPITTLISHFQSYFRNPLRYIKVAPNSFTANSIA